MRDDGTNVVLVTGGAGYVGSHTCKALAQNEFRPVTYDNLSTGNRWAVRWGPLEIGDLMDLPRLLQVIRQHRPRAVIHLAGAALVGESVREPGLYWRANLLGTHNVAEACLMCGIRHLIFSSTCAVYGAPARVPIRETEPAAPINPYGASKLAAERLLADYGSAHGLRHVILRYFNAAGADAEGELGEHRSVETHLIPLMLDAILQRRPPLRILGDDYPTADGTAIRDYIYVADLATAHVNALRHLRADGRSVVANLGTSEGHSVKAVLEMAAYVTGQAVPYITAPRRPGDPPELVADASFARHDLELLRSNLQGLERIIETAWAWQAVHRPRRVEPDAA